MKLVLVSALCSTLLVASNAFAINLPTRAECKVREENAAELVLIVKDRFQVGEVTSVEVNHALIQENEIRLACASIIRGDAATPGSFCAQKNVDIMNKYLVGIDEEARAGQRTFADLAAAKNLQAQMKIVCAP